MSKRPPPRAKKAARTPAAKPSKAKASKAKASKAKASKPKATKSKAAKATAAKKTPRSRPASPPARAKAAKAEAPVTPTPRRARRPSSAFPRDADGVPPVQPDARREGAALPPALDTNAEGFAVTISKTVAAPAEVLHAAWAADRARSAWLTGCRLSPRDTSPAGSVRFAWEGPGDEGSDVAVSIAPKAQGGSMVSVRHARLPDAGGVARARAFWSHRLEALRLAIEGGRLKP